MPYFRPNRIYLRAAETLLASVGCAAERIQSCLGTFR